MERLGDIVARVLANVRDTMEEEKAGDREGPRQLAARQQRGGADGVRVKAHDTTPKKRSQQKATHKAIGVMRR